MPWRHAWRLEHLVVSVVELIVQGRGRKWRRRRRPLQSQRTRSGAFRLHSGRVQKAQRSPVQLKLFIAAISPLLPDAFGGLRVGLLRRLGAGPLRRQINRARGRVVDTVSQASAPATVG